MSALRVIIVEGPDNVGKTTFLHGLAANVHHASGPMDEEAARQELVWIQSQVGLIALDRSMIGEYVYGPLYRDSKPSQAYESVVQLLRKLDPLVLLITATSADMERLGQRPKSDERLLHQTAKETDCISKMFVRALCATGPWNACIFPLNVFDSLDELHAMMRQTVDAVATRC